MSYTEERLWSLLRQAEELPFGGNRTALVEQVIAEADAGRHPMLAFQARMAGTTCYIYGGEPAKSVETFAWCLAEFDRDPAGYAESRVSLLWHFKSTVTALLAVPETPLARVGEVIDDMERRWAAGGYSPHAVYSLRHLVARHVGDEKAAWSWYHKWLASPRDRLSDCAACDPGRQVRWLTRPGRDSDAIKGAEPVLDGRAARAALLLRRAPGQPRLHRPGHGTRTAAAVTAAALGEELAARALELAGRFDARNGSGYQSERVREVLDGRPIVAGLSLVPPLP